MIDSIQNDRILILDFGSQVTQLIARRIRESGVYCEIYPYMKWKEGIDVIKPLGIILSGGPASVIEESSPQVAKEVLDYAELSMKDSQVKMAKALAKQCIVSKLKNCP